MVIVLMCALVSACVCLSVCLYVYLYVCLYEQLDVAVLQAKDDIRAEVDQVRKEEGRKEEGGHA
jgi:hypothetical protein